MSGTGKQGRPLRLLGIFAHPDGESFCAGRAQAMVVSFTRSDAGQIRDAQAATRRALGQVREQELRKACKQLGVQHATCLDEGSRRTASRDGATLRVLGQPYRARS